MATRDDEGLASRQLARRLRAEIEKGSSYPPGARLPSYRQLAETNGLARNTAAAAVRILESEGLVEIRGTSGAFVREPAGTGDGPELASELVAVQRQLREARRVLSATEDAVAGLLTRFPTKGE
ncbi:DNA-binding transcriptional regulator YhcF (GntR family) [Actinomadura luteofluorescens]|uniref:DNA-binding transcriptional regulator YhcF (GntR family) n=1 Tax=Actinomadura luteofluorescens TaxID=46163 RepID=A0A7Y9JEQ6_9ACTN|nr:winged helix-turn-helix domain-containing protein [Actinomadura luteofluorescens]NYD45681.1 DNA-binding transcriptional regulator YhcF (GntR family) [Actinomadura luteofluorescens]